MNKSGIRYLSVVLIMGLAGCQHLQRYGVEVPEIKTVEELGSMRVSVLSVAPWKSYRDALQSDFDLSEVDALKAVAAPTRRTLEKRSEAVGVDAKATLPTSVTNQVTEVVRAADGQITETENTTKTRAAGDIQTATFDAPRPALNTDTGIKTQAFDPETLARINARSKFQAANALRQEVELLNRYVKDVALRRDYVPYVVRLQVTLMPRMRHLPYDAYVNLGFYEDPEERLNKRDGQNNLPLVIPLFATDSLESGLASAELARASQLRGALSALSNIALSVSAERITNDLESAVGHDHNSLFTIGRLGDNVVRVRLGAFQQIGSNYAMVPRTETVTLLVMAHSTMITAHMRDSETDTVKDPPLLHIHSYSEYFHVSENRGPIPTVDDDRYTSIAKELLDVHGVTGIRDKAMREFADELWSQYIRGNWGGFLKIANRLCHAIPKNDEGWYVKDSEGNAVPKEKQVQSSVWLKRRVSSNACTNGKYRGSEQLWSDVAYYQPYYGLDNLRLELPSVPEARLFDNQSVVLIDDGKSKSTVQLHGGAGLEAENLCGWLFVPISTTATHKFGAQAIQVSDDGGSVALQFPSPGVLQLGSRVRVGAAVRMSKKQDGRCITGNLADSEEFESTSLHYLLTAKAPQAALNFSLSSKLPHVVTAGGSGSMRLVLASELAKQETISIAVNGANLVGAKVNGKSQSVSNTGELSVSVAKGKKKTALDLDLKGLVAGDIVLVTATNSSKKSDKPVSVVVRKP